MNNSIEQRDLPEIEIKKLQKYHIYDKVADTTRECIVIDVTQNFICAVDGIGNFYEFNFDGYCQWENDILVLENKPTPKFHRISISAHTIDEPFTVVQLKNGQIAVVIDIVLKDEYRFKGVSINAPVTEMSWVANGASVFSVETPLDIEYVLINRNNLN